MEQKAKEMAQLLKVLANENRLLMFCELMRQPFTVGKLAERMPGISQSALSQHLSLLKAHGIVDFTKSGQHVTYFIADNRVVELIQVLKKYYCEPEDH